MVLEKIIGAKGCVVPDEFLRHGRRARRWDGKGMCTARLTKRQRKDTNSASPHHPDLDCCYEMLLDPTLRLAAKKGRSSGN